MSELDTTRLRLARERRGLTQVELSQLLGAAPGLAGQWERGVKEPSLTKLKQLARALGVRIGWLLGEGIGEGPVVGLVAHDSPDFKRRRSDAYISREGVLADYNAPLGLQDLASDVALAEALQVQADEWTALGSFQYGNGFTKDGYLALLLVMRTSSLAARRRESEGKPGL